MATAGLIWHPIILAYFAILPFVESMWFQPGQIFERAPWYLRSAGHLGRGEEMPGFGCSIWTSRVRQSRRRGCTTSIFVGATLVVARRAAYAERRGGGRGAASAPNAPHH